jgi:hypothetical protein
MGAVCRASVSDASPGVLQKRPTILDVNIIVVVGEAEGR